MALDPSNYRKGDPLTAATIQEIVKALQPSDIRADGIDIRRGPGDSFQLSRINLDTLKVAQVTTAITAFSGTTPGVGVVELWTVDPSTGEIVDSGIEVDNVQNLGPAVSVNVYGFLAWDDDAIPWWLTGGGSSGIFFCVPTTLGPYTGTFPTGTAGSQTGLTVYQAVGGVLTSVGTATVWNYFPGTPPSGKVMEVFADGSGAYAAGPSSCV